MALLDIRQRAGYLFLGVVLAQIILVSAQVNSRAGVPVLQAVTFGIYAEMQRAASAVVTAASPLSIAPRTDDAAARSAPMVASAPNSASSARTAGRCRSASIDGMTEKSGIVDWRMLIVD